MSDLASPIHDKEAAWEAFHAIRNANSTIPVETRLAVFEASNWRCCYCGVRLLSPSGKARETHAYFANEIGVSLRDGIALKSRVATIEHILRRCDGGTNEYSNLAAACTWCNSSRQDRDAEVWFDQVVWMKERGLHPHW